MPIRNDTAQQFRVSVSLLRHFLKMLLIRKSEEYINQNYIPFLNPGQHDDQFLNMEFAGVMLYDKATAPVIGYVKQMHINMLE